MLVLYFFTIFLFGIDYKSKKMEKLLAALSLPQVGEIRTVPVAEDPEHLEGLFSLELNTRMYTLRAKSDSESKQWVEVLSKLREQGLAAISKEAESRSGTTPSTSMGSLSTSNKPEAMESESTGVDAIWIKQTKPWGCC